jgi:Raf kinase inhibitor-like YbhB/YbcL family protein
MALVVECAHFADGLPIPIVCTADGQDFSPELHWNSAHKAVKEWVLIVDDPDAPSAKPWVHWLLYNLAPQCTKLPGAVPPIRELTNPAGARQGQNSWGTIGYRGPAPPRGHGAHRYRFHVHGLDRRLELPPGVNREQLNNAMEGHVIEQAVLTGTYRR